MSNILALVCLLAAVGCSTALVLAPCTAEKLETEAFLAENPGFTGREIPLCDERGYFQAVQFKGSMALCVSERGTPIRSYAVNRGQSQDMNCQCARDQFEYSKKGIVGKTYSCEMNGNYSPSGCLGSVCFCQDQFGKQVGEGVHIAKKGSLNC